MSFTGVFLISKICQKWIFLAKIATKMPRGIEKKLIEVFKDRDFFSREELLEYYRHFEADIKEGTFGWRIYDLKRKNIIRPIKRGLYKISFKPKFKPSIAGDLLKITRRIHEIFKDVRYSIWETGWLNEFTQHQVTKSIIIIDIEKGLEETLFYALKDFAKQDIYLNPDERQIDFYIAESKQPVIIKKLISRAPVLLRKEHKATLYTPTLEKILVDLFAEKHVFYQFQGSELLYIVENAIEHYTLNFTRLLNYAKRRERDAELKQFISTYLSKQVNDIIDD